MSRLLSDREGQLQKRLIPVNIITCAIAITAIISLLFGSFLTIDIGKIINNEKTFEYVDKIIEEQVGGELEGSEQEGINYAPVVSQIIKSVFGKAEGTIEISAYSSLKVAMVPEGSKSAIITDTLLFGDKGLVTKLINSIVDGVGNIFESKEGKQLIEETLVTTLVTAVVKDDSELAEKLTEQDVQELTEIFKGLEEVSDGDVSSVSSDICDKVEEIMGEDLDEETKQDIYNEIKNLYDKTYEEVLKDDSVTEKVVTTENIICVAASSNIELGEINISELLNGILNDENKEENNPQNADINGEEEGGLSEDKPDSEGDSDEDGEAKPEKNIVVVTTYDGLLSEMGFGEAEREELKENLRNKLNKTVNDAINDSGIDEFIGYYGYFFYIMLVFMGLWAILFLFSFFHMFAKNKRFQMWYVKLLCWIPSIIWVVLKLGPVVLAKYVPEVFEGDTGAIIKMLLSCVSTLTWINGLCYVLLWLISILWAFPIKHMIRKERRNCKRSY